ncbi:MAG TPA: hypothetical protein VGM90_31490 [Kofleriaceae bacterium]
MNVRVVSLVAVALASSSAVAAPSTTVFPLSAPNLPISMASAPEELSQALADAIDGTVAKVPIDDAALLLECDAEATTCLDKVARSYKAERIVFGTIEMVDPDKSKLKVTLTRFEPGPDRQQRTYNVEGNVDQMAKQLVKLSRSLFGGAEATPDEPKGEGDGPDLGDDKVPEKSGAITPTTWGILGSGVVVAAVGGGFLYSSYSIQSDVNSFNPKTDADFTRLTALQDKGSQRRLIGGVLTTVGAAAIIYGVVRAISEHSSASAEAATVSHFAPMPTQGGGGLVFTMELP